MSMLEPAGPWAARTLDLWWLLLGLGLLTYVVTMAVLVVALGTRPQSRLHLGDRGRTVLVGVGGIVVPGAILTTLIVANVGTLSSVSAAGDRADLTLDVVAHQFWWEVRYSEHNIATANELHIPVRQKVQLRLTSVDVIHSLWVPRLAGKTDLNPGFTSRMWLEATEPGEYRGQCAEFCGTGHARMALSVVAEPPAAFETWISAQQQPATTPTDATQARGAQAFASLGCINCHALRYGGTAPVGGGVGPDLTHLGSRRTLAAGQLPNDVDSLMRWVADPKALKPGATMPPTSTDSETLRALATYLGTLR
jgi:cytochrome c oxidase subunit II